MLSWNHSGFHVYVGARIWPDDETALSNLAKYIIRACFSQQRMVYIPLENSADGVAKVIYTSKDGRTKKHSTLSTGWPASYYIFPTNTNRPSDITDFIRISLGACVKKR
jgi:hypothetical protein